MRPDELQVREETKLYPPRFVITGRRSCAAQDSRVVFRFKGATRQIVKDVILTPGIVHTRSIQDIRQMLTASWGKFDTGRKVKVGRLR